MNKEVCSVCGKMMGNSMHTVFNIVLNKDVPVHQRCVDKLSKQVKK